MLVEASSEREEGEGVVGSPNRPLLASFGKEEGVVVQIEIGK